MSASAIAAITQLFGLVGFTVGSHVFHSLTKEYLFTRQTSLSTSPTSSSSSSKQLTAIVIGGGQRGFQYSLYSLDFPNRLRLVGLAEPRVHRYYYIIVPR